MGLGGTARAWGQGAWPGRWLQHIRVTWHCPQRGMGKRLVGKGDTNIQIALGADMELWESTCGEKDGLGQK